MRALLLTAVVATLTVATAEPAGAQGSLSDTLSFLLTNRSVATGDFAGDAEAAAATRDTIRTFLLAELASVPISSPASGFTYRLDPELGIAVRSSTSFGPLFVERSLTAGRAQTSFGLAHTSTEYDNIDGRELRSGSLVATASRIIGEPEPFDAETLTLRLRTRTVTLTGVVGVTDRLDLSAAIPLVKVNFSGERIDTYRGTATTQAEAVASAAGLGDIIVRVKHNAIRRGPSGLAVAAEVRLPTGDPDYLLGAGETVLVPRIIGSFETDRLGVHANAGYAFGDLPDEIDFAGALTFVVVSRLTLIGEFIGRRLDAGGRLTDETTPHPTLTGIETIRLSGAPEPTTRVSLVGGFRWNVAQSWLLSAHVIRPVTSAGLNPRWQSSVALDYFIDY